MKDIIQLSKKIPLVKIINSIQLFSKYYGSKKVYIDSISSINYCNKNSLIFLTKEVFHKKFDNDFSKIVSKNLILDFESTKPKNKNLIFVKNCRIYFNRVLKLIKKEFMIKNFKKINKTLKLDKSIYLGKNVILGKNVKIFPNVYLENCVLGDNIVIGPNTSIGYRGLVTFKKNKQNITFESVGKVIIKNNIEIGSNCIIARGTIENTIIFENSKLGNNISIGHNCKIGKSTEISSGCKIGGGVQIKPNCFIGLGSRIKSNVIVEKNNFIGLGSVVVNNTFKNSKMFGVPARKIQSIK
jgi:UDP-3-O-[3-hydroxymyristoyl] glucosamine N-acyltransferase